MRSLTQLPEVLADLAEEKRFCVWRYETRNGNPTKAPYRADRACKTLIGAQSNNPETWVTFAEAVAYLKAHADELEGVGIMLGNGVSGVDLDHVIDENGNMEPEAAKVYGALNTYTEYSPSGTGLHLLFRNSAVFRGHKGSGVFRGALSDAAHEKADIELYTGIDSATGGGSARFFTFTLDVYGEARPVRDRTETAVRLHGHYWPEKPKTAAPPSGKNPSPPVYSVPHASPLTDSEILDKLREFQPGIAAMYYSGDTSAYDGDHSRADQALAGQLIFWSGGDIGQADRMFRASALMRPKWDEKRGAQTYGELTLGTAAANNAVYTESRRFERAKAAFSGLGETEADTPRLCVLAGADITQHVYIGGGQFAQDADVFSRNNSARTGYANIDRHGPFYPGLYVIGAASSLGKTTFVLQLADQAAATGRDVLFIALEQGRAELTAKSIARCTYEMQQHPMQALSIFNERPACNNTGERMNPAPPFPEIDDAYSAIRIRAGQSSYLTERGAAAYSNGAGRNLTIAEGDFSTTAYDVAATVTQWMESRESGEPPLIILDYLQALAPVNDRQTDKQRVDQALGVLKNLQRDLGATIVAVSSLNRANYLYPVSFESFKETGGIEFTADVVWGLDLACLYDPFFDKQGHIIEKREIVDAARRDTPREIVLTTLKNRFGTLYRAQFYYDPAHDLYVAYEPYEGAYTPKPEFPLRSGTAGEMLQERRRREAAAKAKRADS